MQSFVDGALPDPELARTREHVAACEDCAVRVAEVERLRWLLRSRPVAPSEGLAERVTELLATTLPVAKLRCREARVMASAYLDEELNQAERERLEAHLFACEGCYGEYVTMRAAAGAFREAAPVRADAALKGRIAAAVAAEAGRTAQSQRPLVPTWRRALAPALALAAVALFALGVFHLQSAGRTDASAPAPTTLATLPPATAGPEATQPSAPAPDTATSAAAPAPVAAPAPTAPPSASMAALPPMNPGVLPGPGRLPPFHMPAYPPAVRGGAPTAGRSAAPPVAPATPAGTPRSVAPLVPTELAAVREGAGLGRSDRTPPHSGPGRPVLVGPSSPYALPASLAAVSAANVGVTPTRHLPSRSDSSPSRSGGSRVVAVTRPEPRPAPTAERPSRLATRQLEDTPDSYASVGEVAKRQPPATHLAGSLGDRAARLREASEAVKARILADQNAPHYDF